MHRGLRSILLVDDNPATNLIHSKVLNKVGCAEKIHVCTSGDQALELLTNTEWSDRDPMPQLVFLDINMPGMSGWDFVEEYEKSQSEDNTVPIMMLTTSINPDDRSRADMLDSIAGFFNKPLTPMVVREILDQHF